MLMGFAWRHVWDMQMVVEEERRSVVAGFPGRSTYSVPGHRKTKIEQIPDKLEFGLVFFSSIFFLLFRTFLVPAKFAHIFLVFLSAAFLFFASSLLLFLQDFSSNMLLAIMIISTLPARPVEK